MCNVHSTGLSQLDSIFKTDNTNGRGLNELKISTKDNNPNLKYLFPTCKLIVSTYHLNIEMVGTFIFYIPSYLIKNYSPTN